ncbi:MAG: hypothetical protein AAFO69_16080, partial [Bacteroidota bacterium]
IGSSPSDFMKSLKEFSVIDYHTLSRDELADCFRKQIFPQTSQDPNMVDIPQNGLSIRLREDSTKTAKEGSDHLMRLFYYQKVLKEIGCKYFTDDKNDYIESAIVEKAATANIVTPLSSLVVLESQQDYDRFDIKKKDDSLGNASINNAGAVPEPHEWALIIIGLGLVGFTFWKSRNGTGLL